MLIPFFVLTTLDQFRIITNTLQRHKDAKFGIMITPHTVSQKNIEIISKVRNSLDLAKRLFIFCDSGAYLTNSKPYSYIDLFNFYEKYADYGAILDVLYNPIETLHSAEIAMTLYKAGQPYSFKLVGVLQGKTFSEYMQCYFRQKQLGYQTLAIGGVLNKYGGNKAAADKDRLDIAINVAKTLSLPWFFIFGVFSEKRFHILEKYFWGADSKRWFMSWPQRYLLFLTKLYDLNSPFCHIFELLVKIFRQSSSKRMKLRTIDKSQSKYFSMLRYQFAHLIKNLMCLIAVAENDPVLIALAKMRTLYVTMAFMQAYLDELALMQTKGKEYSVNDVFTKAFLILLNYTDESKIISNRCLKQQAENMLINFISCYLKDTTSIRQMLNDLNIIDSIFKQLRLFEYINFNDVLDDDDLISYNTDSEEELVEPE